VASNNLSYIGLAHRAGKTLAGSAACEKGIRRGKVRLLLVGESMSDGSKRSFARLCERCGVEMIETPQPIGKAIGRADVMVIGITDQGFATTIVKNVKRDRGSGKA